MKIRKAKKKDKRKIIEFIKAYWNENHIFVKSETFFDYWYFNENELNFMLAVDKETIIGILGYEKYRREYSQSDIFLEMWMVSPKYQKSNVGIKLNKMILESDAKSISCCGINKKVIPLYEFLGYQVGKLNHYYMLNSNIEKFNIAKLENKRILNVKNYDKYNLIKIENFESLIKKFNIESYNYRYFYKDQWSIEKRYFKNPYYKYSVYGIIKNNSISSIIIARVIEQSGTKILRIIDFIGNDDDFKNIGNNLKKIMIDYYFEYIDFYQFGIDHMVMENCGFVLRDEKDKNIIPNYFEPFEQKNVDIYFATNVLDKKFYMFKGDGDQDRPNMLLEELNYE